MEDTGGIYIACVGEFNKFLILSKLYILHYPATAGWPTFGVTVVVGVAEDLSFPLLNTEDDASMVAVMPVVLFTVDVADKISLEADLVIIRVAGVVCSGVVAVRVAFLNGDNLDVRAGFGESAECIFVATKKTLDCERLWLAHFSFSSST